MYSFLCLLSREGLSFVLWSRVGPQLAIGELHKSVYNLSKRCSHPKKSRKENNNGQGRVGK